MDDKEILICSNSSSSTPLPLFYRTLFTAVLLSDDEVWNLRFSSWPSVQPVIVCHLPHQLLGLEYFLSHHPIKLFFF